MRVQNGRATVDSQTRIRHLALGRDIPERNCKEMTSSEAHKGKAPAVDLSASKAAVWLSLTVVLAFVLLYFVGVDQGATSILGSDATQVHEFVHDARHLLGFPCH